MPCPDATAGAGMHLISEAMSFGIKAGATMLPPFFL